MIARTPRDVGPTPAQGHSRRLRQCLLMSAAHSAAEVRTANVE